MEPNKVEARRRRFGNLSEDDKKKARAAKFGTYHPDIEKEKILKRQQKFSKSAALTEEEIEKQKRRAMKFGTTTHAVEEAKKEQRRARFAAAAAAPGTESTAALTKLNTHLLGGEAASIPPENEQAPSDPVEEIPS